jgi:FAD dependent oxidoreductase
MSIRTPLGMRLIPSATLLVRSLQMCGIITSCVYGGASGGVIAAVALARLATFCVSATHVCFASIRMEPPYMVLSESAALAAHSALEESTSVQRINPERFAKRLRDAGQIVTPADIPSA